MDAINIDAENPEWPHPLKLVVEKAFDSMISDDPNRVKPPDGVEIPLEDRITQAIEKAWEQAGKVLVEKIIVRGGKEFKQKFWVDPKQAEQLGLKPIEQPAPTYAPRQERGRPTTAENIMDLPHSVFDSIPSKIGDKRFGPKGWQEMSYEDKMSGLTETQKYRIITSIDVGQNALAEIYEGKPGFHVEAKKSVQGVLCYEPHKDSLHISFIASAPWNYGGSNDVRKVTGVGGRLLGEIFDRALSDPNIKKVDLSAYTEAKPFYRGAGFSEIESEDSNMEIDRVGMEKFLKSLE
jgi:hypothetical protein